MPRLMRFSASRLKTWQACQLQARFKYVDMLPPGPQNAKASFGVCIHDSLALYNTTGNIGLAIERFRHNWINPERLGVTPQVWPKMTSFGSLMARGITALENYHAVARWDDRRVLATEHEFTVPFGEHELHGFVDLIDVRKSGKGKELLRITDYKTNSKRPNMAELALDIQFTVYDYASRQREFWTMNNGAKLYEEFKDKARRDIWFHLWDGVELDAGDRDQKDFERLYQLCVAIQKAHDAEVFVPRIGDACLFCPYTEPCGLTVPTQQDLAAEPMAWI